MKPLYFLIIFAFILSACQDNPTENNYDFVLKSLKDNVDIIDLSTNNGESRILISPQHQGKILISSYCGLNGIYNGWVNTVALEDVEASLDKIGGEERLWLCPLGSQFSFYYQQIRPISDGNWKVPEVITNESYNVESINEDYVDLSKTMQLTNFIGRTFKFKIDRRISLFHKNDIEENLNIMLNDPSKFVAFETSNSLTNLDSIPWKKQTGLVGLWSAGMYQGTDDSVVIIPLKNNGQKSDVLTYLAPIDNTRFIVKNNTVLFKADGKYRSKIGIPPEIAPDIYGCYSETKNRLTIVQYKKHQDTLYSNSYVRTQDEPYRGEAIPIYNNSENFYELESNAPLKELKPNEKTTHWHRVYHFSDSINTLNNISKKLLFFDLNEAHLQ